MWCFFSQLKTLSFYLSLFPLQAGTFCLLGVSSLTNDLLSTQKSNKLGTHKETYAHLSMEYLAQYCFLESFPWELLLSIALNCHQRPETFPPLAAYLLRPPFLPGSIQSRMECRRSPLAGGQSIHSPGMPCRYQLKLHHP